MTNQSDLAALAACPFCGKTAAFDPPAVYSGAPVFTVRCCIADTGMCFSKEAAIKKWNRRALAARLPDGYVMAPREIVEAVLKRDGGTACGCNNVSRQADREYEMGKCPHQRLAAAMIAASPTASPEAGDPPA